MRKTDAQLMEEKKVQMQVLTDSIQTMIRIMNPKKRWRIEYYCMTDMVQKFFTDWDKERFKFRNGQEYICFWNEEGHLLYVINVSIESPLYAGQKMLELLTDKF